MKVLGIVFIFSAFSFFGFIKAKNCLSALEDIKRTELFIRNIIFCLQKENMTVGKIFENCFSESDEKTKGFLLSVSPKNFGEIASFSLKSNFCKVKEANRILQDAFSVLGKYSAAEQLSELEFCRKKLLNLYEKNEEILKSKAKLFRYLGVLSGIFFAIILI